MFALLWAIVQRNPVSTVYTELTKLGHQLYSDANGEINITIQH